VNCSQANQTTFAVTNYTTYVFYLRGDSFSTQTDNTRWVLQSYEYALSNPTSPQSIGFQSFLASVKTGLNYTRAFSRSTIYLPSPSLGINLVLSTGINFVTISEISLTSGPGYVYAVVVPRTDIPPTPYQIMNQVSAYGERVSGSKQFYGGTGSLSISIAGLAQSTKYTFYFIATNSDFTDLMQTTIPLSVPFSTQTVQISGSGLVAVNYCVVLLVFVLSFVM
jgi:hypothetical protein